MSKIVSIGLCRGRHEIPAVEDYIFQQELDPLDIKGMFSTIDGFFKTHLEWGQHLRASQWGYEDNMVYTSNDEVNLYVTGLTVAVAEVIRYCYHNGIALTLYHYDRASGEYYPQTM